MNSGAAEVFTTPVTLFAPLAGDYNQDGAVDAADYTTWRDKVGSAILPNRDPEATGEVGLADYEYWKANFGTQSTGAAFSTVPEPSAALLLVVAAAVLSLNRLAMYGCKG